MVLVIRLYRQHDLDLISLYKNPDIKFNQLIRYVVRNYINEEVNLLQYPSAMDLSSTNFRSQYQINLRLNPETDADIIQWLDTIKPRFRCNTIKNLLRASFGGLYIHSFFTEEKSTEKINSILQKLYKQHNFLPLDNLSFTKKGKKTIAKTVSQTVQSELTAENPNTETHIQESKSVKSVDIPEPIVEKTEYIEPKENDVLSVEKQNNDEPSVSDDNANALFGSFEKMLSNF